MNYYDYGYGVGLGVGYWIFLLAFSAVIIAALWKIYAKAGQPGWASIVPVYNYVVMLRIIKMDWWHILIMFFVPFAAAVYSFIIPIKLAKAFGKSNGFAVLTLFFPFVCYPILAFGKDTYQG